MLWQLSYRLRIYGLAHNIFFQCRNSLQYVECDYFIFLFISYMEFGIRQTIEPQKFNQNIHRYWSWIKFSPSISDERNEENIHWGWLSSIIYGFRKKSKNLNNIDFIKNIQVSKNLIRLQLQATNKVCILSFRKNFKCLKTQFYVKTIRSVFQNNVKSYLKCMNRMIVSKWIGRISFEWRMNGRYFL